jgi:hypothetical protein
VVSITWLFFSMHSLGTDEIGSVTTSFIAGIRQGDFNLDRLAYLGRYALEQWGSIESWGFVFYLIGLYLIARVLIRDERGYMGNIIVGLSGLICLLLPIFMFYVASFDKGDMSTFLWVSFNRAQFPGVILLFLAAYSEAVGISPS